MPPEEGEHPLIEVESASATEHAVLTVCAARKVSESAGDCHLSREGSTWRVQGDLHGVPIDLTLVADDGGVPVVTY